MRLKNAYFCVGTLLCSLAVSACAVPRYDVPYDAIGHPSVHTIVERIQCELRDLVRSQKYGGWLRSWDMEVLVAMSIDVNESGGLTPTLAYMNPAINFTFGASGTLSESRQHTFTQNLQYSMRQIYIDSYSYDSPQRLISIRYHSA